MELVGVQVHNLLIVRVKLFPGGDNLLTIRVKRRVVCKCLWVDGVALLKQFIGMFGMTAVVAGA